MSPGYFLAEKGVAHMEGGVQESDTVFPSIMVTVAQEYAVRHKTESPSFR